MAAARAMASSFLDGFALPIQDEKMFRWLFSKESTEAKLRARQLAQALATGEGGGGGGGGAGGGGGGGVFIHMDREAKSVRLHGSQDAVQVASLASPCLATTPPLNTRA